MEIMRRRERWTYDLHHGADDTRRNMWEVVHQVSSVRLPENAELTRFDWWHNLRNKNKSLRRSWKQHSTRKDMATWWSRKWTISSLDQEMRERDRRLRLAHRDTYSDWAWNIFDPYCFWTFTCDNWWWGNKSYWRKPGVLRPNPSNSTTSS